MDFSNVKAVNIGNQNVKAIHDSNNTLLWSKEVYDVHYNGDTSQISEPTPSAPQPINTVTGRQVVTISDGGSQSQSYEVNLGKNLFNGTYVAYVIGGSSGSTWFSSTNARSAVIECQPNTTYTVSKNTSSNRFVVADYPSMPSGEVTLNFLASQGSETLTDITVTTHSDAKYLFVYVSNDATEPQLQIEKGSTASSYAQYFTPIELCKIGDYQDYIYNSGGDWYIHKATNKVILNGTENWTQTSLGIPYTNSITDYALSGNTPVSDYFVGDTNKATASDDLLPNHVGFNIVSTTIRFWVKYLDRWTTGASLATWLTTHPATVYYALRAPTDTQITNADLIAQLDTINDILVKYGYSYTVSGNLPLIINTNNI